MESYIASLPDGLASYPEARVKGSLVRSSLTASPRPLTVGMGLPPRLEAIILAPPAASDWIPEAELWALRTCMYDRDFADAGGMAAYSEWVYGLNLRLLRSPLYRILFAVLSPERLFVGSTNRWSAFHKGTSMEDVQATRGRGRFRLKTPPYLVPDIGRIGAESAHRAALELAGAEKVVLTSRRESPSLILFDATWV